MSETEIDAVAFVTMVQNSSGNETGIWGDDWLEWYKAEQWLNIERGLAVFISNKIKFSQAESERKIKVLRDALNEIATTDNVIGLLPRPNMEVNKDYPKFYNTHQNIARQALKAELIAELVEVLTLSKNIINGEHNNSAIFGDEKDIAKYLQKQKVLEQEAVKKIEQALDKVKEKL